MGRISSGGTVIDLDGEKGDVWLASPSGLFRGNQEGWLPVTSGIPFVGVNAVVVHDKAVFVAGMPHGVVRSSDLGRSWYRSWMAQTDSPVVCMVASPNFRRDSVILGGTAGDGVLRSSDGGRFWELSNFGLREFSVLALATAPEWGRREYAFVATEGSVYTSPNGGRAWKRSNSGLDGIIVQTLTVSPNFAVDRTVLAGTEADGIYRSQDGGKTWHRLEIGIAGSVSVNCLVFTESGALLAGTGVHGVLRSIDGGDKWYQIQIETPAVLSMKVIQETIYAGLHEIGVMVSTDNGESWNVLKNLTARRFNLLSTLTNGTFVAGGFSDGIWFSRQGGSNWALAPDWSQDVPVLGLTACDDAIMVARPDGLIRSEVRSPEWEMVLKPEGMISAVASLGRSVWVGTNNGQIWFSSDCGNSWDQIQLPSVPLPVLALNVQPTENPRPVLVAAVTVEGGKSVQFWRSTNGGDEWYLWLDKKSSWKSVHMAIMGGDGIGSAVALGAECYICGPQGWVGTELNSSEAPITAMLSVPEMDLILAAIGPDLYVHHIDERWEPFDQGMKGVDITALCLSPQFERDSKILALSLNGEIWRRELD
jgi:photosystem II stability/assembly factor-like uncharacterized protein